MEHEENNMAIRRAFMNGWCPCCQGRMISWPGPDGTEWDPAPIAEGVMACGRCHGNQHFRNDDAGNKTLATILNALAKIL
jgi:hypothetical protein